MPSWLIDDSMGSEECHVVSGRFAIMVQLYLAGSVLAVLCFKRYMEMPKRSWTIWFMDTSKQGLAMGMQHFVNIVLAIVFARGQTKAGECAWYITNFSITLCCGLVILMGYMKIHRLAILDSGNYGEPPQWQVWLVQVLLWCFVSCAEKFITAVCVILPLRDFLDESIAEAEAPLKPYPRTELFLVMVAGPALLNGVYAWVVDNIIMDPAQRHRDATLIDVESSCED
jgi:hypothetical protein